MSMSLRRLFVVLPIVPLLLFPAACQRDSPETLNTYPSRSGNSTPSPAPTGTNVAPAQQDTPSARIGGSAETTQRVELIEYQIRMPQTLRPGPQAFTVANGGKELHGLIIEGNGEHAATTNLPRGDSAQLDVNLKPGTYEVWCPVKGHKEKGMRMTVTVQ